jgi:uncharacterized phiE125 gp8 family phage protein
MASVTTVVKPTVQPVTLQAMKTFLRVDNTSEDDEVASMIADACQWIEERTGRRLLTQSVQWILDLHWKKMGILTPSDPDLVVPERYADKMIRTGLWIWHQPHVQFPVSPVQSITSFTYRLGGTDVDYDMTNMRVEPEGLIIFDPYSIPPLSDEQFGAMTITASCGYGDTPDKLPESFMRAIKMLCSHWYENRGLYYESGMYQRIVDGEMAAAVTDLLRTKRKLSI